MIMNSKHAPKRTGTYFQLLQLIREYSETMDKLPPEEMIAEKLNVSRVKIRDLLLEMEVHGFISRKRGVGTLINKRVLMEKARVDIDHIFEEAISDMDYNPSTRIRRIVKSQDAPAVIYEKLELPERSSLYLIEKTVFADGDPAICLTEYVPEEYFDADDIDLSMLATNTYAFIQNHCDHLIETMLSHIDPVVIEDDHLAGLMELPVGSPLLKIHDVCYSTDMKPIVSTIGYYNTKLFPLAVFKHTILSREVFKK